MNTQNPSPPSDGAWPPPLPPELQPLFDAVHEVIHPPPAERARMRRDLCALLAAEERRINAELQAKKARKRTILRGAAAALLLAAVVSALAVATVATVVAIRDSGRVRYGGAPNVKLPAPAEPAGTDTPAGPQAPRRTPRR